MYIPDYIEQIQPNIRSYTWKRRNKTTKQRILGKKIKHKLLWNWSMHNTKENYIIHSMKSNSKIHNFQTKLVRKLAINFNRQYSYADLIQWFCSHARKNAWHTMSSLPGFHSFFFVFLSIRFIANLHFNCNPSSEGNLWTKWFTKIFNHCLSFMSSVLLIKRFSHPP